MQDFEKEYAELERQHAAGEISYDELTTRSAAVVARHEQACPHPRPYVDGATYVCDDCGARLRRNDGGGSGGAVVVKSGCAIAALLLGSATYGVIEAVLHLA